MGVTVIFGKNHLYFVYKTFLMPTSGTASPELVAQAEPEPYDAYEGFAEGEEDEDEDYNEGAVQEEEPEQQPQAQEEPEEQEPLQEQKPDTEQMSDPNSFEGFSGGMGGAAY